MSFGSKDFPPIGNLCQNSIQTQLIEISNSFIIYSKVEAKFSESLENRSYPGSDPR